MYRAIYMEVFGFTLASKWSLSLCRCKDFSFSSLALLVLVLFLVLYVGLFMHPCSGICRLCYCIEDLIEFNNYL